MISDIIIEIFAMESALLRTLKKVQKEGEEKSEIHIAVTRVYINDAFAKPNGLPSRSLPPWRKVRS